MKVQNEKPLPSVSATMNGATVDLAVEPVGTWTALLFYRGHW